MDDDDDDETDIIAFWTLDESCEMYSKRVIFLGKLIALQKTSFNNGRSGIFRYWDFLFIPLSNFLGLEDIWMEPYFYTKTLRLVLDSLSRITYKMSLIKCRPRNIHTSKLNAIPSLSMMVWYVEQLWMISFQSTTMKMQI